MLIFLLLPACLKDRQTYLGDILVAHEAAIELSTAEGKRAIIDVLWAAVNVADLTQHSLIVGDGVSSCEALEHKVILGIKVQRGYSCLVNHHAPPLANYSHYIIMYHTSLGTKAGLVLEKAHSSC